MVELKISQGAKPGHAGGVLPAAKVSEEISRTRGVPMGQDCISPSGRFALFGRRVGPMMEFIAEMRRLSSGKPAGFKLVASGIRGKFLAVCKAGAADRHLPRFHRHRRQGWRHRRAKRRWSSSTTSQHAAARGPQLRPQRPDPGINARWDAHRLARRQRQGHLGLLDIARAMALGADWCNATHRGFHMFRARLHPVAELPHRQVPGRRFTWPRPDPPARFPGRRRQVGARQELPRRATLEVLSELVAATGLDHPNEFMPAHLSRRVSAREVVTFETLYPTLRPGELIAGTDDARFRDAWKIASAESFRPAA